MKQNLMILVFAFFSLLLIAKENTLEDLEIKGILSRIQTQNNPSAYQYQVDTILNPNEKRRSTFKHIFVLPQDSNKIASEEGRIAEYDALLGKIVLVKGKGTSKPLNLAQVISVTEFTKEANGENDKKVNGQGEKMGGN